MGFVEKVKDTFRRKEVTRKVNKRLFLKYKGPGFRMNTFRMFLYIFFPIAGMGMIGTPYVYDKLYSAELLYQPTDKAMEEKKRLNQILTVELVKEELRRLEKEENRKE